MEKGGKSKVLSATLWPTCDSLFLLLFFVSLVQPRPSNIIHEQRAFAMFIIEYIPIIKGANIWISSTYIVGYYFSKDDAYCMYDS